MAAKIRKGDRVIVLSGRDKGKRGEVLRVFPADERALVSGINLIKRHQRQSTTQQAGIITKETPIPLSKLAHPDPSTGKAVRIGFKFLEGNRKVRISRKSGEVLAND